MYQKLVQAPAYSTLMKDSGGASINVGGAGAGAGAFGRAMRGRRTGVHPTEKVHIMQTLCVHSRPSQSPPI
jgi:hypothetical protein